MPCEENNNTIQNYKIIRNRHLQNHGLNNISLEKYLIELQKAQRKAMKMIQKWREKINISGQTAKFKVQKFGVERTRISAIAASIRAYSLNLRALS